MATGDYKLIKTNSGGTFDEKTVTAENGKALAFNVDLDPVMVSYQPLNTILTSISGITAPQSGFLIYNGSGTNTVSTNGTYVTRGVALRGLWDAYGDTFEEVTDVFNDYDYVSAKTNRFAYIYVLRGAGIKLEKYTNTGFDDGFRISVNPSEIDMITQKTSVVIDKDDWTTGTSFKEYVIEDTDILAGSFIQIIPANADYLTVANAQILPNVLIEAGQITIYALEVPTADITVSYNISQ